MNMNIRTYSFVAVAGALLASTALPSVSHAIEVTAVSKESSNYNSNYTSAQMRMEHLRQRLARERIDRAQGDQAVRDTIKLRMDQVDARVTQLDQRVTQISTDVDLRKAGYLAEIEVMKKDVQDLRNFMNAEYAKLDVRIANLRSHMNSTVNDLQTQINQINASINDLNARYNAINARLNGLWNLAYALNSRLEYYRACMANGSCVGYKAPQVQTTEINVWGGDAGYSQYTHHYNTGLTTAQWQYCALAGGTNVSRRDFYIYESGGYWIVANEYDNYWVGDQEGNLTARCMRVF